MRSLSSLSSSIIGAGVDGAKEDISPEETAAAKAAADRGRAREEGEEARVVGVEDAADAARRGAAEAARQRAASRTAEQTAEATAAELTSDGMEYDRLIHAHRSSIAREEGEEARIVAAEDAGEAARHEAHTAAKRRASTREEEEVYSAHLVSRVSRVLRSTWRGSGCTVLLALLAYPTILTTQTKRQRADEASPGKKQATGGEPASPLHRAVCTAALANGSTCPLALTPRPNHSPSPLAFTPRLHPSPSPLAPTPRPPPPPPP